MSRIDKEMMARNEGMILALKIVKEGGIEALEREVAFRNKTGYGFKQTEKEVNWMITDIKKRIITNVFSLVFATIRDEFDFGPTRLKRLYDRCNSRAHAMIDDLIDCEAYRKQLKAETGINIDFNE